MTRRMKLAIVAALIVLVAIVPSTFGMHLQSRGARVHFGPHHAL